MSRRILLVLVIAGAAVGVLASAPGQRAIESARLLGALGTTAGLSPHAPQDGEASRDTIGFTIEGRDYAADLYRAQGRPRAALLLVPGLAPEGKEDGRLVDLAIVLARAGFAVLVPDIASLRAQRVGPENVRQIADGLTHLVQARDAILGRDGTAGPIGIAAVSYTVGPALLATLEPELQGRVDFLIAIGGYYDVGSVITYFTTGFYRDRERGSWITGTPNDYGKWLFVAANAGAITDLRDRTSLRAIAGRRMDNAQADIADLVALLGPEGRSVHALLVNEDPDRTEVLIADLPPRLREALLGLDLRGRDLSGVPRHVVLIHGRDDRIIPVSESVALATALPADRRQLYLVDRLAHADLEPSGWSDILTLWRAVYRVLQLRDGAG